MQPTLAHAHVQAKVHIHKLTGTTHGLILFVWRETPQKRKKKENSLKETETHGGPASD